jgi:Co/Zn/Cd efflux system component
MFAEHAKGRYDMESIRMQFLIKVIIPTIAVMTLLGVTAYITMEAINILLNPPPNDVVHVSFLYAFSIINLLVDLYCIHSFYYRGENVFIETMESGHHDHLNITTSSNSFDSEDADESFTHSDDDLDKIQYRNEKQEMNLNMLSAFTHVGGDTLRSISVLTAAAVSSIYKYGNIHIHINEQIL